MTYSKIPEKLRSAYDARSAKLSPSMCSFKVPRMRHLDKHIDQNEIRSDTLSSLSSYRDLFLTKVEISQGPITRDAITLHTLNHVFR